MPIWVFKQNITDWYEKYLFHKLGWYNANHVIEGDRICDSNYLYKLVYIKFIDVVIFITLYIGLNLQKQDKLQEKVKENRSQKKNEDANKILV